jgi:hypothetical protein
MAVVGAAGNSAVVGPLGPDRPRVSQIVHQQGQSLPHAVGMRWAVLKAFFVIRTLCFTVINVTNYWLYVNQPMQSWMNTAAVKMANSEVYPARKPLLKKTSALMRTVWLSFALIP